MDPQTLLVVRAVVIFVAGLLASRGLISKETQDYLASPETLAVMGTIGAAIVAGIGYYANRPKARAADAVARDPGGTAAKLAETNPQTIIAAAATVPAVQTIVTDSGMAAAIPNDKVVPPIAFDIKHVPVGQG